MIIKAYKIISFLGVYFNYFVLMILAMDPLGSMEDDEDEEDDDDDDETKIVTRKVSPTT